jgi:soluble lytic murein transglycosylase
MAATGTSRRPAQGRSPSRSKQRAGRPSKGRLRTRRGAAVAVAVALGVLVGVVISFHDEAERAILEVTLPLRHEDVIRQQAGDKGVDPALIAAVVYAESRFNDQTSHAGARGLMQITPGTAREIEKLSGGTTFKLDDLSNPQINISYGTFYLQLLLERYDGNVVAALAAYNAGPTNADSWGGSGMSIEDIPTDETRGYVADVLDKQGDYRDKYARELGY